MRTGAPRLENEFEALRGKLRGGSDREVDDRHRPKRPT
jgi:hypothetical protein